MSKYLKFKVILLCHPAALQRILDRLFAVKDLLNTLLTGNAFRVVAIVVERLIELTSIATDLVRYR